MRVTILAVGRLRQGPERELLERYLRRIEWPVEVREVTERRPLEGKELIRREGELLLAAIPDGATVVALDERGKTLDSEAFARRIEGWEQDGVAEIVFVIGGADGLDDSVRRRAALSLAFGAMTWPHLLVRVLLAEQLYRAQSILQGHPYHRGQQ